jgi:hypothetical protein
MLDPLRAEAVIMCAISRKGTFSQVAAPTFRLNCDGVPVCSQDCW